MSVEALAKEMIKLPVADWRKVQEAAIKLLDDAAKKRQEEKKKKLPTTVRGLYLYELWTAGNGGIESDHKFTHFLECPTREDILEMCSSMIEEQSRGYYWKRITLKTYQGLLDKRIKLMSAHHKADKAYKDIQSLVDFYVRLGQLGYKLH